MVLKSNKVSNDGKSVDALNLTQSCWGWPELDDGLSLRVLGLIWD